MVKMPAADWAALPCNPDTAEDLRITDFGAEPAQTILNNVLTCVEGLLIMDAVQLLSWAQAELLASTSMQPDNEGLRWIEDRRPISSFLRVVWAEREAALN